MHTIYVKNPRWLYVARGINIALLCASIVLIGLALFQGEGQKAAGTAIGAGCFLMSTVILYSCYKVQR